MKLYIISLYECYALDDFIKHLGYTADKDKAKSICDSYENSDKYYAVYREVEEL